MCSSDLNRSQGRVRITVKLIDAKTGYQIWSQPYDRPLSELSQGDRGTISRVRIREPEKLEYLAKEGLFPEIAFRVEAKAPFGGPIRLRLDAREVVLGSEISSRVWVEDHRAT